MIRILTVFVACLSLVLVNAQSPQKMSYQAVIKDSNSDILKNTSVGMQISILQGVDAATAIPVYIERQNPTTNLNGLVSVAIGGDEATVVSGGFSLIDWSAGNHFIKTETDINGGSNYTITGISQLLSVPYALYAASGNEGPTGPQGEPGTAGPKGDMGHTGPQGEPGDSRWNDVENGISYSENNVGIGTDSPVEKLDVNGNLKVSGDILVDSQSFKDLLEELALLKNMNGIGTVTDIDGNVYKTVKIGDQIWMAENLRVTHFNDGTPMDTDTSYFLQPFGMCDDLTLYVGNCTWYDYEMYNLQTYGALYNVESDKICPIGWHVSTYDDWENLISILGGHEVAGGKLKARGTDLWEYPNAGATNESGFSALPGGNAKFTDPSCIGTTFNELGRSASFWISDVPFQIFTTYEGRPFKYISYDSGEIGTAADAVRAAHSWIYHNSIRCVKDHIVP